MCEGKRDRIFLAEVLRTKMNVDTNKIRTFEEPRLLERAIMSGEKAPILVCKGNGYPGNTKVAVRLSCKFMRHMKSISMGVVGDSDRGSVYDETTTYLTNYLGTHCRVHALRPRITKLDSGQKATISLNSRISVTIWTFEVPESLERRISEILKSNYRELADYSDEEEVINRATEVLRIDEESLIRRSVSLLQNESWLNSLCHKARACINLS